MSAGSPTARVLLPGKTSSEYAPCEGGAAGVEGVGAIPLRPEEAVRQNAQRICGEFWDGPAPSVEHETSP